MEIEFGLMAKELKEQLADYNLPNDKVRQFQAIADFIISASISHSVGDKQVEKLNILLGREITQAIREHPKNENNELKPCPFCGTGGIDMHLCRKVVHDIERYYITCEWCGSSTGLHFDKENAIKYWNKRADDGKGTDN
ncbi:MAG: Lar family restriction alleviation protein [Clostridia bacterium]|nr:Lar family restriction alleviation protein [Clostridia bacterium]